ncbi:uncharacterized protein LOC119647283 isoform X2 [Hermetia illucens]|uniref:uncharacterized protein LOC119647283 isoform X2 n=1 Tax=Hermetia illucens TaxID=343691 RepID=UPI0018CC4416|nr:uncharacterized protein LOC119647283 isoform X2 [Hermetia illucens]
MADEVVQDNVLPENPEELNVPQGEGFDPSKMPSLEELLKMVDGMQDMSEEERNELRAALLKPDRVTLTAGDYIVFITMISIILLVFAFFGYKLYKSLTEKDRKREEKLKAKQAKKKK